MKFEDMINTIQLGDCYELIKNIPDKSIDLVYIDVPYAFTENGLNVGGGCFGTKKRNYHDEYAKVAEDNTKSGLAKRKSSSSSLQEISYGIDYSILDELCRVMRYIYIYIWCSKEQVLPIMKYFIEEKHCFHDIMVWCKTNPIPTANGTYLPDLEYCLMFREKGTQIGGTYETKNKWYISETNKKDKDKFSHPTIKPLNVVKNHITNSTKENDIVLDCFCGSGTTCLACKETGRRYIGMEIDPEYHKIAVDRVNGITASGQMSLMFNDKGEKI